MPRAGRLTKSYTRVLSLTGRGLDDTVCREARWIEVKPHVRLMLSGFLAFALLLTPGVRALLGLPCPCCNTSEDGVSSESREAPRCPCCTTEPVEGPGSPGSPSSPTPSVPERPSKSTCTHWSCGGGFVPLLVVLDAPMPQRTPDLAVPLPPLPYPDCTPACLEPPPRLLI
jgi:hypothetical protein